MILYLIFYTLLTVAGMILLKMGSSPISVKYEHAAFSLQVNVYVVIGLVLYVLSFFTWIFLLRNNSLSYIVPISTSIIYVLSVLSGTFFFHEKVSLMQGLAIVFILIGIVLLNLPK